MRKRKIALLTACLITYQGATAYGIYELAKHTIPTAHASTTATTTTTSESAPVSSTSQTTTENTTTTSESSQEAPSTSQEATTTQTVPSAQEISQEPQESPTVAEAPSYPVIHVAPAPDPGIKSATSSNSPKKVAESTNEPRESSSTTTTSTTSTTTTESTTATSEAVSVEPEKPKPIDVSDQTAELVKLLHTDASTWATVDKVSEYEAKLDEITSELDAKSVTDANPIRQELGDAYAIIWNLNAHDYAKATEREQELLLQLDPTGELVKRLDNAGMR